MRDGLNNVNDKITSFKRKYYLNLFVRGALLTISIALCYYLLATILEYNLWLGRSARLLLFATFFLLVIVSIHRFLKQPLAWWIYKRGIGQEESATMIGRFFPEISDRLLNVIQLSLSSNRTPLLQAGIDQKSAQFENIQFESAIDLAGNKRYVKYLLVPLALAAILLILNSGIFTQSTARIIRFNQEFSPAAPFKFLIQNKDLIAFYNEDYTLNVRLEGNSVPDAMYLVTGNQRVKLETVKPGEFVYTFEKIQNEIPFQLEASGFYSDSYRIALVNRPELTQLKLQLAYPRYLNVKADERINTGNIEVPEGTKITWVISTAGTTKATMEFSSDDHPFDMQQIDDQMFSLGKGFHDPAQYGINLENEHSKNKDKINYSVLVLKDQYPKIDVEQVRDSMLYKSIYLGGNLEDDYGLTALVLHYQIVRNGNAVDKEIKIGLNTNASQQSFVYQWNVDSLALSPGDRLNYYLQVWDNDGVNGHKATKSRAFVLAIPGAEEMKANIAKSQSAAESKIDQSLTKAKDIRESMEEAQQKLKGKQSLDWQDKKMLEDLVQQKNDLDKMINDLQKQNKLLEQKKDAFSEQDEKIREKAEQIQKIMDELLDPETKKLFEELEKLLKENSDINQIQKMLDKMNRKEINLEKELERTLELFKQLQLDYKLDQAINELKEQVKGQEELLKKTDALDNKQKGEKEGKDEKSGDKKDAEKNDGDKKGEKSDKNAQDNDSKKQDGNNDKSSDNQALAKDQEQLNQDFKKFENTVEEMKKLEEELGESGESPSKEDMQGVEESQQESKESLEKGDAKNSSSKQKKSIQKMKQMQQQLEQSQSEMEMEIDEQVLESLRQIVHGLVKLSYDQESLMKDFGQVQQTDPKYVQLSQNQLKIKDDSKVLEDSLLSLGKKDAFLGSIITKEVGELNSHLDKGAENIRERRKSLASNEMQLSMTSINNLAVMLNEHYEMMQEMMANAKPGSGKSGKKKGKSQESLSQLQKDLNMRIEKLKNGGKSGREYSEELAKMAAEQERIRRALQEMQNKMMQQEGGKVQGNEIPGKMEQTEMDLVNKQITEQTIKRQKEIEVRLLEAEKSMREQDMDEERKGETAKDYDKEIPAAFEDYLRLKEKEVELLKTVPPKLYPYYKREVNEYFKRIGNQK